MRFRFRSVCLTAWAVAALAAPANAQESPAKRLGNIVAVAVEEYAKGVDARGRLSAADEYQETVDFLVDARVTAAQLNGSNAAAIRAWLDSLTAAVRDTVPPARLAALHRQFVVALGDSAAMRGVSAEMLYRIVSAGVSGTAMPAWGGTLTSQQRWNVTGYVQSLQGVRARCPSCAVPVVTVVAASLDSSLAAARAGDLGEARARGVDAYLAFEPLEAAARVKSAGAVSAMERRFAEFRAHIAAGDLARAARARDAIVATLPSVVALGSRTSGAWERFVQSFVIIVREGFEAILVIGAIVAFLIKTGHRDQLRSVWLGAGAGV